MIEKKLFKILGLSFLLLLITLSSSAQSTWVKVRSFPCDSSSVWNVDVLGNVYIGKQELLNKFDSTGALKYSQSIKNSGNISGIHPVNTMKVVVFSEEQQLFCYLDNTLTSLGECKELAEEGIMSATQFAGSVQSDKCWVLDQLNYQLHLLSFTSPGQKQVVKNFAGIFDATNVTDLNEQAYQLFVVVPDKGVYVFDMYGTLLELIEEKEVEKVYADEVNIYFFKKDSLRIKRKLHEDFIDIILPFSSIIAFVKQGEFYYFQLENEILKYSLNFQ